MLIGLVVLAYVVVQAWFIWPEYGHRIIYKYTVSPAKILRHDTVLRYGTLTAGIDRHGDLDYISGGAWINTIAGLDAPYVAFKNPMAHEKDVFERIVYDRVQTFGAGDDITAASFSGYAKLHPQVRINTTYSIFDPGSVLIRSVISSAGKSAPVWVGDRLQTNTRHILFNVPGIGDINTGARDGVSPQRPYIAVLGRANQVIGLFYIDGHIPPYFIYQENWIESVFPVGRYARGGRADFRFTRVLSIRSTTGMDYRKVGDSMYKGLLSVGSGVMITASSYDIFSYQNAPVTYRVYVTNTGNVRKRITSVVLFAPSDIDTSKSYTSVSDVIGAGRTSEFSFRLKPAQGGDYYIYPAVVADGTYIEGPWSHVFSNAAGWYSADMHNHSVYSFNLEDYPVRDMAEAARAKGLDILSLTDYNTFSQAGACRSMSTDDFLCIPGEEIANPVWGHANAQFIHEKVYEFLSPQHWIDEVHKQGGMFFINHPYLEMREWRDFDFKGYDGIEILNGNKIPMDPVNVKAFDKWDELNRKGLHLYGIADSDAHTPYSVGTYRDYVYASSFTVPAVEQGFKKGMFYVSDGPMLSFTIDGSPMGSTIAIDKGSAIRIQAAYLAYAQSPENASDMQKIIIFKDGSILTTSDDPAVDYSYTPDGSGFYRVEVFTNNGGFAASNPIWVNVR
ncbi:MAG: CehA/McbA family metallohydrolase [Deltaproteobacteria bacterium]|nr:CehA/McbA family metallohydrolase [Deltaproteobacteria bacterium]MCL5277576.1 CehA/McbA family metallohydrolase [Deltaproteobacteria bacterium]